MVIVSIAGPKKDFQSTLLTPSAITSFFGDMKMSFLMLKPIVAGFALADSWTRKKYKDGFSSEVEFVTPVTPGGSVKFLPVV